MTDRKRISCLILLVSLQYYPSPLNAWVSSSVSNRATRSQRLTVSMSSEAISSDTAAADTIASTSDTTTTSLTAAFAARELLTHDLISKLRFRELHRELEQRNLSIDGTTSTLRERLRVAILNGQQQECVINDNGDEECITVCLIVGSPMDSICSRYFLVLIH
jgi:hypothetical protein